MIFAVIRSTVTVENQCCLYIISCRPPAHHSTIKTAIALSHVRAGKEDIFTADQQIYKIVINVVFREPLHFDSIIPVLGGMYMLMNFIHAAAIIMKGFWTQRIPVSTFGSLDSIISRKKPPYNLAVRTNVGRTFLSLIDKYFPKSSKLSKKQKHF